MGYFGSEGIYEVIYHFGPKNSKKNFGPNVTSEECTSYKYHRINFSHCSIAIVHYDNVVTEDNYNDEGAQLNLLSQEPPTKT